MDTINSSHSYAIGGTSAGEFWTDPKRLAQALSTENEESCTTFNMLKISRNLFRWRKSIEYADYYERALINGVLSIQRGSDPGVMIYMLPQAPGRSKATNSQSSKLNVRIPSWTSVDGAKATLNDKDLGSLSPGSFLSITKLWNSGDHLLLHLPISLRTEAIKAIPSDDRPEYASLLAVLFGPFVLAGLSTGDWNTKGGNISANSDWISAVPSSYNSQLMTFTQVSNGKTYILSSANGSLTMQVKPEVDGTDTAIHATFRAHTQDSTELHEFYSTTIEGTSMLVEPFDLPGTVITNNLTQST
ncbi:hypothetical protein PR202_ga06790 [Eleusine coracana subsp. coracana]|uniref:Non-reducing end beta-L-arabinofuranosidase-like GH127 catalytic domain-containing protein n=1 Tax=Eleusine coracana subsp. coracana TaxID=191504 RepID=A0AAV5BZ92_ELECO|nr:hypothetical protein PR202_ga06790 [Eleusine coracana subsp. coracana]